MNLHPRAAAAGVTLNACDAIDSTNAEALRRARAGEPGPLWIVAETQSAGRGRHGRTWVSQPGNLHATLLLSDVAPARHVPGLSLVCGLAVHDAVMAVAPQCGDRLRLKWPNDLLLDGAKLGGILIEAEGSAVAIGVGVNCAHHPDPTAYPSTDFASAGVPVAKQALFAALSGTMLHRLRQWARGDGFASIRENWLARAAALGADIEIRIGDAAQTGVFETLDPHGHLILRRHDGTAQTVTAGDVLHARIATTNSGTSA